MLTSSLSKRTQSTSILDDWGVQQPIATLQPPFQSRFAAGAVAAPSSIKRNSDGNSGRFLRILRLILSILRDIALCLLIYAVFSALYDKFIGVPRAPRLALPPESVASVAPIVTRHYEDDSIEKPRYSVFMVSRDRYDYATTMLKFIDKMKSDSFDGKEWRQFLLFDIESQVPLQLHSSLNSTMLQELRDKHKIDVRVVRKEPRLAAASTQSQSQTTAESLTEEQKRTMWKNNFRFSMWDAWSFAASYFVASGLPENHRIFYFDNCNFPSNFMFELFLENGENYYFPNLDRYYTSNFVTDLRLLVRFLRELPRHLLADKRSFQGNDQLIIWYLNSRRAPITQILMHMPHEVISHTRKWTLDGVIGQRIFLYMNRYAHPTHGGHFGLLEDSYCNDKRALCAYDGLIPWIVSQRGVYHLIDALMKLEVFFTVTPAIVNVTDSWILGFFCSFLLLLSTFAITWRFFVVPLVLNLALLPLLGKYGFNKTASCIVSLTGAKIIWKNATHESTRTE